jgi:hypothetical protein
MLVGLLPLSAEKDEIYHLRPKASYKENSSFLPMVECLEQDFDGLRIILYMERFPIATGYGYDSS